MNLDYDPGLYAIQKQCDEESSADEILMTYNPVKIFERNWMRMRSSAWNDLKLPSNCRKDRPFHARL